jgi:formylmethanofuran dehydrogenase subunit E
MIVISVSKTYHNAQRRRKKWGKPRCKPFWVAYILDNNEKFVRKRISALLVPLYKAQIKHKRVLICDNCEEEFVTYVKNDNEKVDCSYCTA